MASLDELVKMDGIVLACEFTSDGRCTNYKSSMGMSPEMANKATQYVATVTMLFNTLADAFTKESQMNWIPQHGWTYNGGDYTAVIEGNQAVFGETSKMDFGELMQVFTYQTTEPSTSI